MNPNTSPPAGRLTRDVLCSTRTLSNDDRARLFRDKLDGNGPPFPQTRQWLRVIVDAVGLVLLIGLCLSWVGLMYVLMDIQP